MTETDVGVGVTCVLCNSDEQNFVTKVFERPKQETDFGISKKFYSRSIFKCSVCGVYSNHHNMLSDHLYQQYYNTATYRRNLLTTFERIMNLPQDDSDNKQRVNRVVSFLQERSPRLRGFNVLDVGSGLCVFLAELKKHGFYCEAIDPDQLSAQHALKNAKVDKANVCSFDDYETETRFDLITFNKVLEHVKNPCAMLARAKRFLKKNGCIYIELPDGDSAMKAENPVDREEFYIEHHIIFNQKSVEYLLEKVHLSLLELKAIHEESDKYTLYAFLTVDSSLGDA